MRLLLLFIVVPLLGFNQPIGSITGILQNGKESVPYANIGLNGTSYGIASNENGKFKLNHASEIIY